MFKQNLPNHPLLTSIAPSCEIRLHSLQWFSQSSMMKKNTDASIVKIEAGKWLETVGTTKKAKRGKVRGGANPLTNSLITFLDLGILHNMDFLLKS